MPAFENSPQALAARVRRLIDSIGVVASEPGYGEGYCALGEVSYLGRTARIDLWMPPQNERPLQLRVGFGGSAQIILLDGSSGRLHASDWKSGDVLPSTTALAVLEAAEQLLTKLDARRHEWSAGIDPAASERVIRAFFSPWPQSLAAALAAFDRQRSSTPIRHPMEMDTEDPGVRIWLTVFAEGHLRGLRLVDFVRERDPIWIADRLREQPEPVQAADFRAAREAKLRPAALAAAIDKHLAKVGWRLVMFDVMYGKPMSMETARQVIADATAAGLGHVRIALGGEAFQ